jgi:WD40 repeat protein
MDGGNYLFSSDRTKIVLGRYNAEQSYTRVFDADSGKELCKLVGYHSVFSPDGKTIATWCSDKIVRIYDTESGKELQKVETAGNHIRFFDEKRIVLSIWYDPRASRPSTTQVLDVASGKELILAWEFEGCSPDGKKMITSRGNVARVWDIESGKELFAVNFARSRYYPPKFSPNGKNFFINEEHGSWCWSESNPSCTCDTECGFYYIGRIWNAESGKELEWDKHVDDFRGFAPDGTKFIMSGPHQRDTQIHDSASAEELYNLRGRFSRFSPCGKKLVTTSSDHTVIIWSLE